MAAPDPVEGPKKNKGNPMFFMITGHPPPPGGGKTGLQQSALQEQTRS